MTSPPVKDPPAKWQSLLKRHLAADESVPAWFEGDLDEALHYADRLFVLTNRRFLVFSPVGPAKNALSDAKINSWNLEEVSSWSARSYHGAGSLELMGSTARLGAWSYSGGRSQAAARFVQRCQVLLGERKGEKHELSITVCPSCGTVLDPGITECPTCTAQGTPETRSLFRLAKFAKPRLGSIVLGFLLTLAATAATLVGPYLTKPLIDDVLVPIGEGKKEFHLWELGAFLGGMIGAAVLAWLLGWARSYVVATATESIASDIRRTTYEHLQKLSLEFFGGKRTGDLISRIGSDSDRICSFLSVQLLQFSTDIFMIIMTAAILLSTNFWLAVVTLVPFPLIAWLIQIVRAHLRQGFATGSRAWSEMVSVLADTIPGIRVVKAFAQENREIQRFGTADQFVVDANNRVNRVWAFFTPIISLLTEVGILVIWAYGAWLISRGSLTVGALTMFIQYLLRFYGRLEDMSRMLASVQRAAAASHRIFEVLDRVPSVAEATKPVHPGRVEGKIELKDVRFSYGMREVMKGIDLAIQPGEMIGLVGPSGAGKSTLVNLVCRFYDVAAGGIYVDGHDIRSFPIQEYRGNIGIVLQDPFLFYGTIAENIAYGRPTATRREIIEAAKAAKAHEFILRLQDGYDSIVGERGQALSGGERQRISIARALLTDPRILILDEATSSVDTETEREIQEALDFLVKGRTTIAVAHRLSTLRNASRIVVLESGSITEIGTHDELLKLGKTYARLHQAQQELTHG